jgi:hypothetical protein
MWSRTLSIAVLAVAVSQYAWAQFGRPMRVPAMALATPASFDGDWHFCRLAYRGRAWATDYPDADYNFSTRLSELTKTPVSKDSSGDPRPLIVRPTDETLFQCPFVMLWQAESLYSFIDVPANHSMFRTLCDVPTVPQFPASASGGARAARRPSAAPTARKFT